MSNTIRVLTIDSEVESATRLGYPTVTYIGEQAWKLDKQIIIRWGNSQPAYARDGARNTEFKNIVNPAKSIRQNCEKAKATKILSMVVNVPTLWEKNVPANTLAVVRPFEHSAGSGFSVKKGPFKLDEGTYATRYLDVTKSGGEYRVWFCGNRTMAGKRVKMECNPTEEFPCRSKWGYEFCDGISKDLHTQTLLAARKLGLDFGAADGLYYKGQWYFLELNTAPSVDHRVVREFFQAGMKVLIDKKFQSPVTATVPVVEIAPAVKKKEVGERVVSPVAEPVTI